jgi:hypothetical protein
MTKCRHLKWDLLEIVSVPLANIQLLLGHETVGTAVRILITSHREAVLVILLILILCVFRDAASTRKCSGVHETSIANLLETRMNTG